jgi:alkanesulfonate monooxygenase SsuD/methylene tetrahydromethanopterin reductase-like flavin-dependent oxidoreductase (luciferase family)
MAAGYILQGDLAARGVPAELHNAVVELKRRYSTRPSDADAALVEDLGLFDYLARRFAIYGTPEECRAQMAAAQAAGLHRVMFTVIRSSNDGRAFW